ncbi:MAG: methyltransferase [Pirellulaceae bacterium]|nr:methyltransferase [Pirellulaceae bacterium]
MDTRLAEQRLIDAIAELPPGRALCNTAGRGQLAAALAARAAAGPVACFFLDLFQLHETEAEIGKLPANLSLHCQADPPAGEVDLVPLVFGKQGDAELSRDLLQAAHDRLAIGGRLAAAIDHGADQWLHEQLRGMFDKVTRRPATDSVLYLATKTKPLKKHKDFSCLVSFRDGERLIELRTRPGVFAHRQVDDGARVLVKAMEITPATRVLDLGCGSGAVGIAAALRAEDVEVQAVDSNPRAIEATMWGAEKNGATSLAATLDCDGRTVESEGFDLVLANPPYFSNFRIATLFLTIAHRALAPGGRLLLVTKTPSWYAENLARLMPRVEQAETRPAGKYTLVVADCGPEPLADEGE